MRTRCWPSSRPITLPLPQTVSAVFTPTGGQRRYASGRTDRDQSSWIGSLSSLGLCQDAIASQLPIVVISEILGVLEHDRPRVRICELAAPSLKPSDSVVAVPACAAGCEDST